ncbi:site-specific integrase [Dactylosporangium sp. NBC_01737]|uniref:site-specific integrase n=1 Tax=Dactylosporangium sp. NBC_01737 TaxID=2975959 RepID=UPI002E12919A|nr:site-specific integrase [Dactylosporangium sp. NBC_01737]
MDEVRPFHEYVAADRLFPMWRLLLTTGLRRGELCGLRWCDLEPDVATLTVRRQRVVEEPTSRVREKSPKSHNGTRSLVLDPATLTVVTGARPQGRKALAPGYMFTGRRGRPLGPHQIRHLVASNLLDLGYGIVEVAERLGHDPATLMRYYSRVNAGRRRQSADDLAGLIAPDFAPTAEALSAA